MGKGRRRQSRRRGRAVPSLAEGPVIVSQVPADEREQERRHNDVISELMDRGVHRDDARGALEHYLEKRDDIAERYRDLQSDADRKSVV